MEYAVWTRIFSMHVQMRTSAGDLGFSFGWPGQ
jgi:hypothetical protein